MSSWPLRHLRASLAALQPLPEPFAAFVDRPDALPPDAPEGTAKILVEEGPLGRGAMVLDTWEGDALAGSIVRLAQALPGAWDLEAAGRVHLGLPGRFVRGFGFLLRPDHPPLLRFELREKEPGTGICRVAALLTRQKDLDRERPAGEALRAEREALATRVEVWIPQDARPWLGVVVGDRRVVDAPGGGWIATRISADPEAWALAEGTQTERVCR